MMEPLQSGTSIAPVRFVKGEVFSSVFHELINVIND